MSARSPHALAEACFAVARSTTHPGERAAAIGRGLWLCQRHGLDPARYAYPGKPEPAAAAPPPGRKRPRFGADAVSAELAAFERRFGRATLEATLRRFEQGVASVRMDVGAAEDERIDLARRRNFDLACAAASERDRRRAAALDREKAEDRTRGRASRAAGQAAADRLWARGLRVYPDGDGWLVDGADGELRAYDHSGLAALADETCTMPREAAR